MNRPKVIEELVVNVLQDMGEDPQRKGLLETPRRVAESFKELTQGYGLTAGDVIQGAIFDCESQGLVLQKGTEFYSMCEHHLLPFFGQVHLAYIPDGKIVGLSKIGRIIDVFARRLQVQERLTEEIANALDKAIKPKALVVKVEASHFCLMMRGVKKQHGKTITTSLRGLAVTDSDLRREIFAQMD
jgi:GTP cyclohydrolase I